jgi:hypothetical protein
MKQAKATIKKIDTFSDIIFYSLVFALVCSCLTYVYFVQMAIRNAVATSVYQNEIASLNSKLSDSEFQYINSVESVTLDTAHQLGFQSASDRTIFVTREHTGKDVAIR